jgi:hypothetical protein
VNNTVAATAFKDIKAPRAHGEREENAPDKGLRVSDKGFMNTAVISSTITYIDGEAGGMGLHFPTSVLIIADVTSTSIQVLSHEVWAPQMLLNPLQRLPHRAARRALVLPRDLVPPHLWSTAFFKSTFNLRARGSSPRRDALGRRRVLQLFPVHF